MCYNHNVKGERVMDYDKIFEQFYKMNIGLGKAMQEAEKKKVGVGNE